MDGQGQALRRLLGLGPALAIIGVFMLLPIGIIAVYSVLEADPYGGVEPHLSAEAYLQFFFERDLDDSLVFNPAYLVIFGRSFLLAAGATVVCLLIAFPVAFLAARNTTFNPLTWALGRFILVASRSVNTVVWALFFVAIFGPGPVAGIWAIAARSIGFMGKLTAEAIEEIDEGTVEAIEATGASRLQVLWIGILPQVLPVIYGTTVYRWDINIRESTVLGFVGAGGIGILLYSSINQFVWQEVSVMLIAIFAVVVVSEFVSAMVRQKIT